MTQIYNISSIPPNFSSSFCNLDFTFLVVFVHTPTLFGMLAPKDRKTKENSTRKQTMKAEMYVLQSLYA